MKLNFESQKANRKTDLQRTFLIPVVEYYRLPISVFAYLQIVFRYDMRNFCDLFFFICVLFKKDFRKYGFCSALFAESEMINSQIVDYGTIASLDFPAFVLLKIQAEHGFIA